MFLLTACVSASFVDSSCSYRPTQWGNHRSMTKKTSPCHRKCVQSPAAPGDQSRPKDPTNCGRLRCAWLGKIASSATDAGSHIPAMSCVEMVHRSLRTGRRRCAAAPGKIYLYTRICARMRLLLSTPCSYFALHGRTCKFGEHCWFAHSEAELRSRKTPMPVAAQLQTAFVH